jgi:peptide/nickel transport system substrate-binding protein
VEAVGLDAFGRKPAGTGSYVVDKFVPGQSINIKYRVGNWREGVTGLPGIAGKPEEIEWVNLPDDAARMAALRAGNIDVASDVPIDEIRPLQDSGFTVSSVAEASPQIFYLLAAADSTAVNPLNDVRVRQAINYAVDTKTICEQLFLGLTKPSPGQVTGTDAFGHNPKLSAFPFDAAKAKQLLTDAGYPNGFTVKAEIRPGALGSTTGQAVASYLGKVGIKVELSVLENTLWTQKIYGGGRAPMFMQGVNYLPMYDADFSYGWFWSKNPAIVAKAPFLKNARFDEIFEQQEKEVDRAKREALLQELGTILRDEAAALFLFNQVRAYGANKKVTGLKVSADQMVYFENISVGS